MANKNQNDVNATDSIGVTEMQIKERRKFREEHVKSLFEKLNNHDQIMIYDLIWTLGAKDLSKRVYKTLANRPDMEELE